MKANLYKLTAILALGFFFVAPVMAFDICGNGYCCTTCIPDERLYCSEDCGSGVTLQSFAPAVEACTVAEEQAQMSADVEETSEVEVAETAPLAD